MNKSEKKKQKAAKEEKVLNHWAIFDKLYPDEAACLRAIVSVKWKDGLICEKCKIQLGPCPYRPRAYQCKICKSKIWPTVGTFFERAKKLKPRFAEIWFLEHKVEISDNRFADLLTVSQSTTWDISHQLAEIMGTELPEHADHFHSAVFLEQFGKRSLDTTRREHPVSEQEAFELDQFKEEQRETDTTTGTRYSESNSRTAAYSRTDASEHTQADFSQSTSSSGTGILERTQELPAEAEAVYNQLSSEPKTFDSICNALNIKANNAASLLTTLELEGLIVSLPGNFYSRTESHFTARSNTIPLADNLQGKIKIPDALQDFADYIKRTFHSISRKHLQNYLTLYWTRISNYWNDQRLLKYCLRYTKKTSIRPVEFITPLWVYMPRSTPPALPVSTKDRAMPGTDRVNESLTRYHLLPPAQSTSPAPA